MTDAAVAALVEAVDDGGRVACDGLVVERAGERYRLNVDGAATDRDATDEDATDEDATDRNATDEDATEGAEDAGLSGDELRARLADREQFVWNWHFWAREAPRGEDRRAWLRWIEDAESRDAPAQYDRLVEGVRAEWGQLSIEVRLEDGERRYGLAHVDDAGATRSEDGRDADGDLETFHDPLEAREIATLDDDGRYRPLKTAPTLRTGWRFPDLDADGLVRAVDCFYPATIPNWYREREGELDVDHWLPTAERQTGIYDLVDELPREALEWVAEACCVDSQCLKRRRWNYEAGDELAVERGDGAFPCREPCSLVIAAARQWTILEDETERTYELELTPAELRQLGAIVDAVADGRVDEVREADVSDPANRFRARYLRAKRLDGDELPARERGDD